MMSSPDRVVVVFPEPLQRRERRRALQAVFELTFDDYIDELRWNEAFTELHVGSEVAISEFPDDRLEDLAGRVETVVPLPEGSVKTRRDRSG